MNQRTPEPEKPRHCEDPERSERDEAISSRAMGLLRPAFGGARNDSFLLLIYQILFVAGGIVYLGVRFLRGRPTPGLRQRLGGYPKELQDSLRKLKRPIWIHLVSLGEVLAARPLIEELRRRFPDQHWVVTTVTATGQSVAKDLLRDERDQLFYLPWDLTPVVRRVVGWVRPALFIAFETELWPVLFRELQANGVPIVVVNGRISPGAMSRYLWIRPFMEGVLAKVGLFLIQSPQDARRYAAMGAAKDRIVVTGNLKWDLKAPRQGDPHSMGASLRELLRVAPSSLLWTAGSTHPGEERKILQVYVKLKKRYPALRLLIAPRHPERVGQVQREVARAGCPWVRRTKMNGSPSAQAGDPVILLDTLGELVSIYQASDLVFVGGSLVPKGGHNLVEPAAVSRPILTGPHLHNFQAIAEALLASGAMAVVQTPEQLEERMIWLLENPSARTELGHRAFRVIEGHQGATRRAADMILRYVPVKA